MYYIIKIPGFWTICDAQAGVTKELDKTDVGKLKAHFPRLITEKGSMLEAVEIAPIPLAKLAKPIAAATTPYLIIETGNIWQIRDSETGLNTVLEQEDARWLKGVFATAVIGSEAVVLALAVAPAPIAKLSKLSLVPIQPVQVKKPPEPVKAA